MTKLNLHQEAWCSLPDTAKMAKNGILVLVSFVLLISFISAQGSSPSYCCEKTKSGAFCVNDKKENCDPNFRLAPTSCESTSYCKLGTCYDSSEGVCMSNTPQRVCEESGGTWDPRKAREVPQCKLGCCIIADQAAFVPLVRCKKLSSFFGVEFDYRKDITSEIQCIATAQSQDMGACVFEKDFEKVCKFTTRKECGASTEVRTPNQTTKRQFFPGVLCSAEELGTSCARQTSTMCYRGKVYWRDSCNNRENVYSSDKEKSWNNGRVAKPEEICPPNDGSNKNCGNCDYLLGSRCAEKKGILGGVTNFCKRTDCVDRTGKKRMNGESWCVYDSFKGNGLDAVGSRHFREVCVDGEVVVEPCADFRNEICIQDSIKVQGGKDFSVSACRVNRWQDCILQTNKKDCENTAKRDCQWREAVLGMFINVDKSASSFSNPQKPFRNPTARVIQQSPEEGVQEAPVYSLSQGGVCVPRFPPGLKFWEERSANSVCGLASARCIVKTEKGLVGGSKKVRNEECKTDEWALKANQICANLGDCGGYINFVGSYTGDGYEWKDDGRPLKFSENSVNKIKGGFTGLIIKELTGKEVEGK